MSDFEAMKLEVRFFRTGRGVEPVREWLRKLSKEEKRCIGIDIKTVQYGWPIGMPLVKHLEKGIWEVRSSLPQGKIARILFFNYLNTMVLLNGFIKKSQKTPKKEIELAKKRVKQFMEGMN